MTPPGSFNLSKREICVIIGLSRLMPYFFNTPSIISCASSLFLSLRGSMDGDIRNCLMGRGREKAGAENTAASYLTTKSSKNFHTLLSGLDTSTWPRHIHLLSDFFLIRAIGCGS